MSLFAAITCLGVLLLSVASVNEFVRETYIAENLRSAALSLPCASNPCQNSGTCTDVGDSFTCECAAGWSGALCDFDVVECASEPCLNGGTCTHGVDQFSCACASGYTGVQCETDIDECASDPCQNGGTCTDAVDAFTCACASGYTGVLCQTDVDECASDPCQNGGTCADGVDGFTCACVAGYTGVLCETDIDECGSAPCQNGATCVDAVDGYTCACAAGFTGVLCETDVDECASEPCQSGGTCSDQVDGYACACVSGYTGVDCETDVDECASSPCLNDGTCVDTVDGYTCSCNAGFNGTTCENDLTGFFLLQPKINVFNNTNTYEAIGVAVSGNGLYMASGGFSHDSPVTNAGFAVVYARGAPREAFVLQAGPFHGDDYPNTTSSGFGRSMALDYAGETLAVTAHTEDSTQGNVRIFVRSGTTWTQQGGRLRPDFTTYPSDTNAGVDGCALSDDGNTLVFSVTSPDVPRVYVFTRSGSNWTVHPDAPFSPSDYTGNVSAAAVDVSGDGLTFAFGAPLDDSESTDAGAVWVFVNNGTTWVQQGTYLHGLNLTDAKFGWSVALTYDGNMLAAGSQDGGSDFGAVSVFTRSGETWTNVAKVTSANPATFAYFGTSCKLSANGTVLVAGHNDLTAPDPRGRMEAFTTADNGTTWTPYGSDMVPEGAAAGLTQLAGDETSLDLSSDGSVVVGGGANADDYRGAAWIYVDE